MGEDDARETGFIGIESDSRNSRRKDGTRGTERTEPGNESITHETHDASWMRVKVVFFFFLCIIWDKKKRRQTEGEQWKYAKHGTGVIISANKNNIRPVWYSRGDEVTKTENAPSQKQKAAPGG